MVLRAKNGLRVHGAFPQPRMPSARREHGQGVALNLFVAFGKVAGWQSEQRAPLTAPRQLLHPKHARGLGVGFGVWFKV